MAPKFVVPYRLSGKAGKNDAADAAAICEAVRRPNMRFVPPKSIEQQCQLMVHRVRQGFVAQRTATFNRIRGLLSELGIVMPLKAALFVSFGVNVTGICLRDCRCVLLGSDCSLCKKPTLFRAQVAKPLRFCETSSNAITAKSNRPPVPMGTEIVKTSELAHFGRLWTVSPEPAGHRDRSCWTRGTANWTGRLNPRRDILWYIAPHSRFAAPDKLTQSNQADWPCHRRRPSAGFGLAALSRACGIKLAVLEKSRWAL